MYRDTAEPQGCGRPPMEFLFPRIRLLARSSRADGVVAAQGRDRDSSDWLGSIEFPVRRGIGVSANTLMTGYDTILGVPFGAHHRDEVRFELVVFLGAGIVGKKLHRLR